MENLLLKKLQIKPNHRVKVVDAPESAAAIFGEIPANVSFQYGEASNFDVLITFTTDKKQLNHQIESNLKSIHAKTVFWVFYPKKSSKIKSDLDLMKTWQELADYGLAPCASAAVNETWTGLRLKPESSIKPSGMRNDHIKTNEYGDYINPQTKTVKIPEDLKSLLIQHPSALDYYNSLAYSHRKEYVLWILSAKQEKTRLSRIEKMLEMLLNGKKNPSDKS
ncbi:hypothetical protein DU508_01440 [Pedobacter chinensis]|uniref:YdeI/OmpD-associated family protein n=1 Tax=Pedobacter chinensis TaxID=2282421 RepID=A0A369PYG2_9SPHI|nr:YdeI/OmpD-associated family protein [Pedobacter chinensis]RDC57653.1 hypothetical protein DU508_01440 [Pedobacter chinensis]